MITCTLCVGDSNLRKSSKNSLLKFSSPFRFHDQLLVQCVTGGGEVSTCKAQGDWIPPSSVAFSILKNGNDLIVPDCDVLSALGHPVPSYSAFENSKKSAK